METLYSMVDQGQSLQPTDINLIATDAALADDRVLWQMVRMTGYSATPQKGIFPYGLAGGQPESGLVSTALIQGDTSTGSVKVMPFRAMIGSQDNSSRLEEMRGVRSGYSTGASTNYVTQAVNANSSGNPRWTLVYASVVPATPSASVQRYVKSLSTGVVTPQTVTVNTTVTVTINTIDGTPASTPTRPTIPADAAGTYNIALAYIWVPTGFTSSSIVNRSYIHESASVLHLHSTNGASIVKPANQSYQIGGTVDVAQAGTTLRPGCYLPSTMVGGEERIILIQTGFAPISHAINTVVDNSTDWRNRYFMWMASTGGVFTTSAGAFASDRGASSPGTSTCPTPPFNVSAQTNASGMGQSFVDDSANYPGLFTAFANGNGAAAYICKTNMTSPGSTSTDTIMLFVRSTDGALVVTYTSGMRSQFLIWLRATGPYSNFSQT